MVKISTSKVAEDVPAPVCFGLHAAHNYDIQPWKQLL